MQASAPPPERSTAALHTVHSFNKAHFHQLMQRRLQQPQQADVRTASHSPARQAPQIPDDPRFVPAAQQPPSLSPRTSPRASLSPAADHSPKPRRPSTSHSTPAAISATAKVKPVVTPTRRRAKDTTTRTNRVNAVAAFGGWQLYAPEDQQPLSARSRETVEDEDGVGRDAQEEESVSSLGSSSEGSLVVKGVMEENSVSRRQRQSSHARGGVADIDTLRRLVMSSDGPTGRDVASRSRAHSSHAHHASPSSSSKSQRRRTRTSVHFEESTAPAGVVNSPAKTRSPSPATAYDTALPPGAWMTRSGAEKMWYARLHANASSSSASALPTSPQSTTTMTTTTAITAVPSRRHDAPMSSPAAAPQERVNLEQEQARDAQMRRVSAALETCQAELAHLRAALVVASNHITTALPRDSTASRRKLEEIMALAAVAYDESGRGGVVNASGHTTASSPSVPGPVRDGVRAVMHCLEDANAHTLTLSRALQGMPVVPVKPPGQSLRQQLSATMQDPLCGVLTVLLPRALVHGRGNIAPDAAPPPTTTATTTITSTRKEKKNKKVGQHEGRVNDGARERTDAATFPLSATPPLPPSAWTFTLESTVSTMAEALAWCPCFVVADDRGVVLFKHAEDYMAGAYARALLAIPYSAFACFMPDVKSQLTSSPPATASAVSDGPDRAASHAHREHAASSSDSAAGGVDDDHDEEEEARHRRPRTATASPSFLRRLFSRRHRSDAQVIEDDASAATEVSDAPQRSLQGSEKAALAQYLLSVLRANSQDHCFGFLPQTVKGRASATPAADSDKSEASLLWGLSRREWARCPPLLFRTSSQQVREEWVHSLLQRFHPTLYLDLFPRFAEDAIARVSHGTQTSPSPSPDDTRDVDLVTDARSATLPGPARAIQSSTATQTPIGAVVAARDLIGNSHISDSASGHRSPPSPITVVSGQPTSMPSSPSSPTFHATQNPMPELVVASAELRHVLDRKNEQLLAAERAKEEAGAALNRVQERVQELLAEKQQLHAELAAARAQGGDRLLVDGQLRDELARLRTKADRATEELAQLRAAQLTSGHGTHAPPLAPPSAEEEEDMVTVMRAERAIWQREKQALLATQQQLAAEVLALRRQSSEGLRALARRAVGDLDLLHDEMMRDTNSLVASTAALSPIYSTQRRGGGGGGPGPRRHGSIRAPPGLPQQEVHADWPSVATTTAASSVRSIPAAERTVSVDGESFFSDLHYGEPVAGSAQPASAHPYGSPGMVQSPRSALHAAEGEAHRGRPQGSPLSTPGTPGRQLFTSLIAPTETATASDSQSQRKKQQQQQTKSTEVPGGHPHDEDGNVPSGGASLAQLLLSFDPAHRRLDGDLTVNERLVCLLSSGPARHAQGRRWELYHGATGLTFAVTLTVEGGDAKKRRGHQQDTSVLSHLVPPPKMHATSRTSRRVITTDDARGQLHAAAAEVMPWTSPHPYVRPATATPADPDAGAHLVGRE